MASRTATMASQSVSSRTRPSGLSEALWACALDDYLSEEEDGEHSKIVGDSEAAPWWYRSSIDAPPKVQPADPRDANARNGRGDNNPGTWSNNTTPEMPPVLWLPLPESSQDDGRGATRLLEPDWDEDVPQKRHQKRQQKALGLPPCGPSRSTRQGKDLDSKSLSSRGRSLARSRRRSKAGSKAGSRAGSRIGSREDQSQSTRKSTRSKSRSRTSSKSRGRSRSRVRSEHRQPSTSKREGSSSRQTEEKSNHSETSRRRMPRNLSDNADPSKKYRDSQERSL
jgi:hypothetical protein